jgi:hypothetical protein
MLLFKRSLSDGGFLALIADVADDAAPDGMGVPALQEMEYVSRASGSRAFWLLLARALEDKAVNAVAVSLNSNCVLDDELPARLEQACARAAGSAEWAVLAATGKCLDSNIYSVVYPSAAPRLFTCNIPRPIMDCGLELVVLDATFLRAQFAQGMGVDMAPEYFPHWCIVAGYLEGRLSIFRPELAIGVNGIERGRDTSRLASMLQHAFGSRLPADALPSLVGKIPLTPEVVQASGDDGSQNPRDRLLARALTPLADLVRRAARQAANPMSLSVVTRTRFTRDHLLRRLLASVTRARPQSNFTLEVVLSTDVGEQQAREAHRVLQADFPELELVLQLNHGRYPHSRVDNLVGGILAARKDYVAIVDDDDFVDLDAFDAISAARFLGHDPLLLMSSQVRDEVWRETSTGRWILESSAPARTYRAENCGRMFLGSNQLPICAMVAPRPWLQARLDKLSLRHDLSEDYAIYLALLVAPDLPPLLAYDDVFCMISSRSDGSNTITMKDRRPWVRDITLFLHDLFVADPVSGGGVLQMLGRAAKVPSNAATRFIEVSPDSGTGRKSREIAMLKAEIAHLRDLVSAMEPAVPGETEVPEATKEAEVIRAHKAPGT